MVIHCDPLRPQREGCGELPARVSDLPCPALSAAAAHESLVFSPPSWQEMLFFTIPAWYSVLLEIQPPRAAEAAAASF